MNWLIQEKVFTYFYDKFRPVNCMHYITCVVNSSLHNSGCCRRSVVPYYCFIKTHNIHNGGDLQIYFGVIFRKTGTMHRPVSHLTHLYTVPFFWPRVEHRRQQSWVDDFAGQGWLWRLLNRMTFIVATLGLSTNLGMGRSWLFAASSIKFLTGRSLKSQWVYLVHMKITVSSC